MVNAQVQRWRDQVWRFEGDKALLVLATLDRMADGSNPFPFLPVANADQNISVLPNPPHEESCFNLLA